MLPTTYSCKKRIVVFDGFYDTVTGKETSIDTCSTAESILHNRVATIVLTQDNLETS